MLKKTIARAIFESNIDLIMFLSQPKVKICSSAENIVHEIGKIEVDTNAGLDQKKKNDSGVWFLLICLEFH